MEVNLSPEQEAKLRDTAARSGRDAQEIISLAVARFLADEDRMLEHLRAAADEGDADIAAGFYTDYTDDTLHQLFDKIRSRGAAGLPAR